MKTTTINSLKEQASICISNTQSTKSRIHDMLSNCDYDTTLDLHKCYELGLEQEVRFQILIDRLVKIGS